MVVSHYWCFLSPVNRETCRNDCFKLYEPDPHVNKGHHYGNQGHKEMHLMKDKGHVIKDKLQVDTECC